MGTMFGFASAALLTPTARQKHDWRHDGDWMPAAPGVIVGSALGVLAAISSGEGGQPPLFFSMFIVGAAALTTLTLCSVPIVRDSLEEVGSAGAVILAGTASFAATMVFAVRNCIDHLAGRERERPTRGAPTHREKLGLFEDSKEI